MPVFLPAANTAIGNTPTAIVTDDFNQDGNTDLAVAQGNGNSVGVLLGNGDGTLGAATEYSTGADPTSIATGDFNNDGVDDIVTADAGSGDVSILLGKADSDGNALGTFSAAVNIHVESPGSGPMSVATGDFNGDGNLDIAVAGPQGLYILAGNGDGTFSPPRLVDRGDFSGVVADSFTPSGNTDLAALDSTAGAVDLFAGDGNGRFAAPVHYSVGGGASSISSGDFNNDGAEDIAVTVPGQNAVEVLLQNTTTVTEPTATQVPIDSVPLIPSGSTGSGGSYTYSVGTGTFASPMTIQLDQSPTSLFLSDVTGDGNLDIVTANGSANSLTVIPGNGDGTFGAPVDIAVGNDPVAVAVDDLNGDGGEDLVSANAGNGASDMGSTSVVLQQSSDVAVAVSASSASAVFGSDLTYTATVTNNGPGPATDVSFDDYLPDNFTLVSAASSTGTVDTSNVGDIHVALGDMAGGASATVTIVAQANQYGPATNSVSAYGDSVDSNYQNDYASINTPVVGATGAEVAITGNPDNYFYPIVTPLSGGVAGTSAAASGANNVGLLPIGLGGARVGEDYTYTFTVTNYGPDSAAGLNFTDTLPDGVTYVSSSASQGTTDASVPGTVTAALGDLASGASATVTVVIKPQTVGTITNSASVAAADPGTDPYVADNSTTSSTYVYSDSSTYPVPVLFAGGNTLATTKKTSALPTFSIGNVRQTNVTSGKTAFVFTVTRSGNLTSPSTVHYSTVNGSANAGANFHAVSGTLTFAAGASAATVSVPVKGTAKYKPDETFVVALSRPGNATLKKSRATGTIVSPAAPPNAFAKGVGINFEPAGGPIIKGYLEDAGAVFGARGNGFTYGWSSINTAAAVIRNTVKDARYDTFNVLGAGGASNWQISLPDGRYSLKIVAGDPTNATNAYQVEANGSTVLDGHARSKQPFVSGSATIVVSSGTLTLTAGPNASFDDLDFLKLKYLGG